MAAQLLVFSNDSDSVTVLTPTVTPFPGSIRAVLRPLNPAVCNVLTGFNRPDVCVISRDHGVCFELRLRMWPEANRQAMQTLDLNSLAVQYKPALVNGATYAFLSGTKLYVAGNGTPTGPLCASLTSSVNAKTAATYTCGMLDIVDLTTMTDPYYNPTASALPDRHSRRLPRPYET